MEYLLPTIEAAVLLGTGSWMCWAVVKSRPVNLSDNPFDYFASWVRNFKLLSQNTIEPCNPYIVGVRPRLRVFAAVTFIWMIPMLITWREMEFGENYFLSGCLYVLSYLPWIFYFLFNARKNKGSRLKLSEIGINIVRGILLTIPAFYVFSYNIYILLTATHFSDMSGSGSYFFP